MLIVCLNCHLVKTHSVVLTVNRWGPPMKYGIWGSCPWKLYRPGIENYYNRIIALAYLEKNITFRGGGGGGVPLSAYFRMWLVRVFWALYAKSYVCDFVENTETQGSQEICIGNRMPQVKLRKIFRSVSNVSRNCQLSRSISPKCDLNFARGTMSLLVYNTGRKGGIKITNTMNYS